MKKSMFFLLLLFMLLTGTAYAESLSLSEMQEAAEISSVTEVPASEASARKAAASFWDMNPDDYDLSSPEDQQAIWDIMMQPIIVLDVDQKDHVYPTVAPGIDKKPWKTNTTGELHGQSQGVNVLEEDTDGDGYVLVESYSNDGTKTGDSTMMTLDNARIRGYVKTSLLKTITPSKKYALLVDKARQKLYIFEAGKIIGSLPVSTGLNNPKQPYNETPAGEFLAISWVGEMVA
nr:L,D-transpeptidase [Clostridiales bacterium]